MIAAVRRVRIERCSILGARQIPEEPESVVHLGRSRTSAFALPHKSAGRRSGAISGILPKRTEEFMDSGPAPHRRHKEVLSADSPIDKVLLDSEGDDLTPRGARKRSALLDATFRIIVRDGPGAVTLRSVVSEASASHGAVKYYFGSTKALIREALKKVARQSIERLSQTWKTVDRDVCDPSVLARIIAQHSFHDMVEDRKRGLIIYELHLAAARDPSLRPIIQAWGRGYVSVVQETFKKLGSRDAPADASLLVNLINGLVISQLALPRKDFADSILVRAIERFLHDMGVAEHKRG